MFVNKSVRTVDTLTVNSNDESLDTSSLRCSPPADIHVGGSHREKKAIYRSSQQLKCVLKFNRMYPSLKLNTFAFGCQAGEAKAISATFQLDSNRFSSIINLEVMNIPKKGQKLPIKAHSTRPLYSSQALVSSYGVRRAVRRECHGMQTGSMKSFTNPQSRDG